MGAPRYSQEAKDAALGALMASAVEVGGAWVPNVDAVSRQRRISARTLDRWWKERDRACDADLRASVTRARDQIRQEGAADLLTTLAGGIRRVVDYILDPVHYPTDLVLLPGQNEHDPVVVAQVRGVRVDHAAKALQILVKEKAALAAILGEGPASEGTGDPLAAANHAAARTGLLKTLKAGSG